MGGPFLVAPTDVFMPAWKLRLSSCLPNHCESLVHARTCLVKLPRIFWGATHTLAVVLEWLLADVTFFRPMKLLLCLGSKRAPLRVAKVSKRLSVPFKRGQ